MTRSLPRVKLIVDAGTPREREVECFADERLHEYRNVANPHESYNEEDLSDPMPVVIATCRVADSATP